MVRSTPAIRAVSCRCGGDAQVLGLHATGSALSGDELHLETVTAIWKAGRKDGNWTADRLDVTAPVGTIKASGSFPPVNDRGTHLEGNLDLAALAPADSPDLAAARRPAAWRKAPSSCTAGHARRCRESRADHPRDCPPDRPDRPTRHPDPVIPRSRDLHRPDAPPARQPEPGTARRPDALPDRDRTGRSGSGDQRDGDDRPGGGHAAAARLG